MKGPYLPLWFLLTVGFAIFFVVSAFGEITIGNVELQNAGIYRELTRRESTTDDVLRLTLTV